jgi:hypothetical protein
MRRPGALLFGIAVSLCFGWPAQADDFRIETKVFRGSDSSPVSQNLTLFQAGYVYDYLSDPERIAVFDRAHGRFILLDPARQVKVELKTDDVLVFSEKFHAWAAKSSNGFMKFAADPDFEVTFAENGQLTLASPHITYRLETVPAKTPETAQQYREFSDWYARFNAMVHLGSTPPFPRLQVNEQLAKRGLVPTEVNLTIPKQATLGVPGVSMRSEHHVSWRLLQRDTARIGETANQLAAFRTVDLAEFEPKSVTKK